MAAGLGKSRAGEQHHESNKGNSIRKGVRTFLRRASCVWGTLPSRDLFGASGPESTIISLAAAFSFLVVLHDCTVQPLVMAWGLANDGVIRIFSMVSAAAAAAVVAAAAAVVAGLKMKWPDGPKRGSSALSLRAAPLFLVR